MAESRADVAPARADGTGPASLEATQRETTMLMTIAIVLLVLWLLGFFAFNVGSALIHLLIILAVIAIVMHFVRGRAPRV